MNNILTILNLFNDAIFVSLVNTTLQMTLLIPLIALVIWVFRIKSPTTRYSLWLFVIFGIIVLPLLTPFISQIDFARFYNQRAMGDGPDDLMRLRMGGGGVGDLSKGGDSVPSTNGTKATVKKEMDVSLINPVSVAYFLWCAGALFMFCITLDAYRRLKKLRISSPDVKDSVALEMLSRLKQKIKVRRSVALKASSEIYTPVSLGVFSHTIILPDSVKTSEVSEDFGSLEMIITHELAHIKRCDYLINFLQNMLRAIFFFHPLFYLVNRNLGREREHICDDWVIDTTNQRSGYAECIISLLEKALYQPVNVPVAIAMAERKRDIPRRIDMIMDKKRKITAKVSRKALIAMFLVGCLSLPVIGGIGLVHFSGARSASNEGRILFYAWGEGNTEIHIMDADGSNEVNLTQNPAGDFYPTWSPDGKKIAFISDRDGNFEVYVMDADGSNVKRLTNHPAFDSWPEWSPDGKMIAFTSDRDGWGDMYIMDADGANVKRITFNNRVIIGLSWAPAQKIAFTYGLNKMDNPIFVIESDGKNQTRLSKPQVWTADPAWSPDGKKIAYAFDKDGNFDVTVNWEIYVMDADGSNVKRLTDNPAEDRWPTWSPDGTKIAFTSDRDGGKYEIYVMNADGSNVKRLTNTNGMTPSWFGSSYAVEPAGKLKSTWGKIKQKVFGK